MADKLRGGSTVGGGLIWHSANDGSGSGLDADLLDGQQGSYYLDWTNTTNKPDPVVTVTLSGDVTGTGNATLTDLTSATISFTTTVGNDSHTHAWTNITSRPGSIVIQNLAGTTLATLQLY